MEYEVEEGGPNDWSELQGSIERIEDKFEEIIQTTEQSEVTRKILIQWMRRCWITFGLGCASFLIAIFTPALGLISPDIAAMIGISGIITLLGAAIFGTCLEAADIYSKRCILYKFLKTPEWLKLRHIKQKEYNEILRCESVVLENQRLQFSLLKFYKTHANKVIPSRMTAYQHYLSRLVKNLEEKRYEVALLDIRSLQNCFKNSETPNCSYYQKLEGLFGNKTLHDSIKSLL